MIAVGLLEAKWWSWKIAIIYLISSLLVGIAVLYSPINLPNEVSKIMNVISLSIIILDASFLCYLFKGDVRRFYARKAINIRLSKGLDNILIQESTEKNTTIKLLIYQIITEYAECGRFNERDRNITLEKETLNSILQELDDNTLSNISKSMGANISEQLKKFSLSEIDVKNYLQYVSMMCRYTHFASYEISIHENNYTLMLTHQLGRKWTIFIKNWIEEGLKTSANISANFDTDANKVIARFTIQN